MDMFTLSTLVKLQQFHFNTHFMIQQRTKYIKILKKRYKVCFWAQKLSDPMHQKQKGKQYCQHETRKFYHKEILF